MPKIEWVSQSMIGQWIYVFFHRRHPKVRNRPTILASLESTGPYQRNGVSLVFMRCVVLEIQLFMVPALQKFSFPYLGPCESGKTLIEKPTQFSAKPLSPQGNYGDKYQACSSRVLHLSNSAEILPKVASVKEQEAASVNTLF